MHSININSNFFETNSIEDYTYYKFGNKKISYYLKNEKKSKEFLQNYCKSGNKEIADTKLLPSEKLKRYRHTLYVYFIGAILINKGILKDIKLIQNKESMLYYWLLISLFHDLGYKIEENSHLYFFYPFVPKKSPKIIKYNHNLFEHKFISCNENINSINKCIIFNDINIFKRYYQYRIQEWKVFDHGILGGLLLYDFLRNNYDKVYKKETENKCYDDFEDGKRHFKKEHFDIYAYCAYIIMQHNLWHISTKIDSKDKIKLYENYKLNELIDSEKINIKKNPFLFLLCFIDTIEFSKKNINITEIEIKFIKYNKIIISCKKKEKKTYLNDIKKLESWMDVECKEINSDSIEILIK